MACMSRGPRRGPKPPPQSIPEWGDWNPGGTGVSDTHPNLSPPCPGTESPQVRGEPVSASQTPTLSDGSRVDLNPHNSLLFYLPDGLLSIPSAP